MGLVDSESILFSTWESVPRGHPFQVVMMLLQQFHQIGRSTRLEPITAEFLIFERIEQTKRIVHADRMMCKVIAVIICFQIVTKLVV